jgi:hypothetical protein
LAEGGKMERADISMPRGSVVTGIVLDDYGEPSPGTQVRVLRYVMRNGERALQQAGQDQSDDRGMYRIYGLQPGEYLVAAAPRNQNVNDLRQTISSEIESLMQQLQGSGGLAEALAGRGGAGRGGAGGAAGGAGGRGGRGGAGIDVTQFMGGGRGGGDMLGRVQALQEQLAEQQTEQPTQYAPVYYPGTASPSVATPVTLAVGEERNGVDFRLVLVATSRVRGMIQSANGLPQGTQLTLLPLDQVDMPPIPGAGGTNTRVNQNGEFTFNNVAPGQYRVLARGTLREQDPNAQAAQQQGGRGGRGGRGGGQITDVLWGSADVSVIGQDVEGVVITLQEGMTISGNVSFQGSSAIPPADLTTVRVTLTPRGSQQGGFDIGGIPPAQVEASGRFTIVGVTPGRYSINATVAGGGRGGAAGGGGGRGGGGGLAGVSTASWSLKSANAAGRDALDFGIEVEPNMDVNGANLVFGDRTQGVSGVIQDTLGQPTADYTIILFPTDRNYWVPQARRIRSARPGTDGRFTFGNLPVGDYRLTAVTDVEQGEWFNPSFLAELMNASVPVAVGEGEQKTQNIRVAGGG